MTSPTKFRRFCLTISSLYGATAIIGGAFGAHALRAWAPERLAMIKTAMHYQLIHAVALLALATLRDYASSKPLKTAAHCFTLGTLLFSASLVTVAVTGTRSAGIIAPFGGTALIAGWLSLLFLRVK